MEKIITAVDLVTNTRAITLFSVLGGLGMAFRELNDDNFWMVREQCRITDGVYTPIHIDGDDKMRFLHVSVDDPAKVSYTKDADKGRQDIQTRTTLVAYCEKFGLDISTATKPPFVTAAGPIGPTVPGIVYSSSLQGQLAEIEENLSDLDAPAPRPATIREKLLMLQEMIDEVLADLG